jgi:hypothetical protein
MCNLQMELYTEKIGEEMGPAARLLPQAALQNRIMAALQPEVRQRMAGLLLLLRSRAGGVAAAATC